MRETKETKETRETKEVKENGETRRSEEETVTETQKSKPNGPQTIIGLIHYLFEVIRSGPPKDDDKKGGSGKGGKGSISPDEFEKKFWQQFWKLIGQIVIVSFILFAFGWFCFILGQSNCDCDKQNEDQKKKISELRKERNALQAEIDRIEMVMPKEAPALAERRNTSGLSSRLRETMQEFRTLEEENIQLKSQVRTLQEQLDQEKNHKLTPYGGEIGGGAPLSPIDDSFWLVRGQKYANPYIDLRINLEVIQRDYVTIALYKINGHFIERYTLWPRHNRRQAYNVSVNDRSFEIILLDLDYDNQTAEFRLRETSPDP